MKNVFSGKIRLADISDIDAILHIDDESFLPEDLWDEEQYQNYIEDSESISLIAESCETPSQPAGYVIAGLEEDGLCHVFSLAVASKFRGQGLGKTLLDCVCESLKNRGVDRVYLHVRVSNEAAIRLYDSVKFVKEKMIDSFYSGGENAWLMVKNLKPSTSP